MGIPRFMCVDVDVMAANEELLGTRTSSIPRFICRLQHLSDSCYKPELDPGSGARYQRAAGLLVLLCCDVRL